MKIASVSAAASAQLEALKAQHAANMQSAVTRAKAQLDDAAISAATALASCKEEHEAALLSRDELYDMAKAEQNDLK